MFINMSLIFKVDDGLNTSYIDALLVALFYKPSPATNMLNTIPENASFLYLQEQIKIDFVEKIKQNYSIESRVLNQIRNYSVLCGWKRNDSLINIIELFNVVDYYKFFALGVGCGLINFESSDANDANITNTIIRLVPTQQETNIRKLLDDWIYNNLLKKSTQTKYHFKEIPTLIPIHIDRSNLNSSVDIMKKIKFCNNNNSNQENLSWTIHSIVCFSNSSVRYYYSLINYDANTWLIYDNTKIPSLIKVDIKNDIYLQNKIKLECVFVIYKINQVMFDI